MHFGERSDWIPSFFIVGPPRTGTTWVHRILGQHATLPFPVKESRFFDLHFELGLAWYRSHFPHIRPDKPVGEVAPTYFASDKARERISKLPRAPRVVCIFRNPVERIWSLYRLKRAYGLVPWSFQDSLANDSELVESSRYAVGLKKWRQTFGAENVLPLLYDDLCSDPQGFMNTLADFVGVRRFEVPESARSSINGSGVMTYPRSHFCTNKAMDVADWLKTRRMGRVVSLVKESPLRKLFLGGGPSFPPLSNEISVMLHHKFRPEVDALESILQRDLTAWKRPTASGTA